MANHPWTLLKLEEYYFEGRSDPEEYFEWEHKMNEFFNLCGCPDFEKVYIAAEQLINQAHDWWSQSTAQKNHCRYFCESSWDEMKSLMRKKYIPRDQYQEIRRKFRTLCQDDKSVMEYHKQFKYLRIRLNPGVSDENVMDQFVHGLRDEIRVHIQRYACKDLEELLQQAVQIEHENKEPEPLEPPAQSSLPTIPTEKEEPSEEVQQHSRDITISNEQVLRTKLFKGEGDDVTWISSEVKGSRNITSMRIRFAESKSLAIEAAGIQQSLNRYFWNDKGLQNYVFKPGGKVFMLWFRGMNGKQVVNVSDHLEGLDLRTNPLKGGGNDANRLSCLENRFDIRALKEAYLSNQKELGNKAKCSGKLTHQSIFRNWSHHNDIKELGVMNFAIWLIQDFRRIDMSSLRRELRPNQKVSSYDSKCFRILSHQGSMSKWNHLKRSWEEVVMNFRSRQTFSSSDKSFGVEFKSGFY